MNKKTRKGALRVWHIPQVPMEEAFYVDVRSIDAAKLVLRVLADYDIFEFENDVKLDYSNAQGLEEYGYENDDGEICWSEWYDDGGRSIEEVMEDEDDK